MARNFWTVVNKVISQATVLLEIVDARAVDQTRNAEIEDKVKEAGKPLIFVLNKCDLANKEELERISRTLSPSVFVSCTDYHGINILKEKIIIEGKRRGVAKPIVGVLGYPNMGKSSVINALTGTGKARASSASGFTKGKQYINTKQFYLIDTPGVIPYKEKDTVKNAMLGINTKSVDPESDVLSIMEKHPGIIESHYNVPSGDSDAALEKIAVKLNCLKKGNLPDTARASSAILKWIRERKME